MDTVEKLVGALVDEQVGLNPNQVDTTSFAFSSPLSKGALLDDEVGLGKTIEVGLILSQRWVERNRRILAIVPSNLRDQWFQELVEKLFLPYLDLEAKSNNTAIKQGQFRSFESPEIVICSYQLAKSRAAECSCDRRSRTKAKRKAAARSLRPSRNKFLREQTISATQTLPMPLPA